MALDVGSLAVQEVPSPAPRGDYLVSIARVGLCGTDLKILRGEIPVRRPLIIGHELTGSVLIAPRGGSVPEGARVLIDPMISCGLCHLCSSGRSHLCKAGSLMGRDIDGGCAELVRVREGQLHRIPEGIPGEAEALLQVLGTCVHAQSLVETTPSQTAVIVGLGVSGLLHLELLKSRGVQRIIGVTRSAEKRGRAKALGALAVASPEEAPEVVAELTGGAGADLVVECAGAMESLSQSIDLAGPTATLLLFGIRTATQGSLPFYQLYYKELTLVNARSALPRDYARGIDLAATGAIGLEALPSTTYPLEQAAEAVIAMETDPSLLKVAVQIA